MSKAITIQINYAFEWHDVATIEFAEHLDSSFCRLDYETDHVFAHYNEFAETAASVILPNDTMPYRNNKSWFRFLDDIMPAGSSRKYWLRTLRLLDKDKLTRNFILLSQGTIAPIGNIRVKESVPANITNPIPVMFSVEDVCRLEVDFIEYAQANGAAAGGASGAGGAAPKLLLRCDPYDRVWIDTFQDNPSNLDTRYLVKFPRGSTSIDHDILRAEFHFYHELKALGFDTIPTDEMRLIESNRGPSLWLPRFDVVTIDNKQQLLGMESVYSVLDIAPATMMEHGEVIRALIDVFTLKSDNSVTTTFLDAEDGIAAFVIEWVRRDLLNIAFGNSDNHGRNTSFIKQDNHVSLAPIYDFAPMKADPEVVSRTFIWGEGLELGGQYDFVKIANSLADFIEPKRLLDALAKTAIELVELKQKLEKRGVPLSILTFPSMGYEHLAKKFKTWKLL
ncbi:type II toxin-antitoxin system HipA family toxin [Shewanella holmiensis]|uniref:HipA domain-containing protein n=1 Tax=Shewanella holmiensis TaxID=2952222 RepID=A0A9X2WP14_9GAMM|nr:HipA domain-containing protein [Shewanella holmiensis]MCT7942969.1 HipA domain-containing protein [Shewanella holmiensis]